MFRRPSRQTDLQFPLLSIESFDFVARLKTKSIVIAIFLVVFEKKTNKKNTSALPSTRHILKNKKPSLLLQSAGCKLQMTNKTKTARYEPEIADSNLTKLNI